jgi:hypothetical protein
MYSVRREELSSGKAREQPWRGMEAGGGLTAVVDRLVREREGEERKREGTEKEDRPRADSSLRQSRQPVLRD